ncbi:hypothetical protein REJC140_00488 [Pseudorhizobium endolithicum]|uniref:Uncharacterized protein n=1 Tax=Pseudorhizobium endolithicum TaxID=1191678 RepID=A0ABN7JDI4_9HYPH|nr:hypothetical protein [Pseudorhizobium endolithicum]CAD7024543.1 hypothetical protein REJC140_00488 [Pseudorhizobium endolithicum]
MGRTERGGNGLAALEGVLTELDERIGRAARTVAEAARTKLVPAAREDESEDVAAGSIATAWSSASTSLASMVGRVANLIDHAQAPLEDIPQPTVKERLQHAARAVLSLRFRPQVRTPAAMLRQALTEADALSDMLSRHRERLMTARRSIEADLVDLTGHRQALADNLLAEAKRQGREVTAAAARVEDYLQMLQTLLVDINRQVADVNLLMNKLTIEAERGILLDGILSPAGETGPPQFRHRESLPHLAPLIDLYEKDMLSSREIDRRKAGIDSRFTEHFGAPPGTRAALGFGTGPEANHA